MEIIRAIVEVSSSLPLEEMARKLGAIIGGTVFEFENTYRYEEVPAFIASDTDSGMVFVFSEIPEGGGF